MGKTEHIEQQIASLAPDELAAFRAWFAEFDADAWDKQIAADAAAGRLDALADATLQEDRRGKTRRRNRLVLDRLPCRVRSDARR